MDSKPLTLAAIGCGSRVRTYLKLAAERPDRYQVVAVADPVETRMRQVIENAPQNQRAGIQCFASADDLLDQGKLADLVIIGTQDSYHYAPCRRALELGYDVLLEKPIAKTLKEALELRDLALKHDCKVVVCHVLRYTPFYRKVREIVQSGRLGEVVSFAANEGVGAWHFAHSFVRGHWGIMAASTPMMVAKCCHDMDIIPWILDRSAESLSSFGGVSFFNEEHRVEGRSTKCVEWTTEPGEDPYDARKYAKDEQSRRWLKMVCDLPDEATEEEIYAWLKESPWGRDVFSCDNDQPDHQVMAMKFSGGLTGTFTVTAFDEGRHIEIYGTKGRLRGGHFYEKHGPGELMVTDHFGEMEVIKIDTPGEGYEGHGGGDFGLIDSLYDQIRNPDETAGGSSIVDSVHSHVIAFASEHARRTEKVVRLNDFEAAVLSGELRY